MKHYGDITKLHGWKLPMVDIITGGSPCQDLSVAGKRAGLAGERSGLFMEQIRIVKEIRDESIKQIRMRGSDDDIRPRYMVWENVPGAFSSNKGEDFRAVLEETARVADKDAVIPGPPKGKWSPSGCIMGDGWSIAWRVHDAQFWGVPQRRKRISLIADFGGSTAPEILFERKGLSGDTETSGKAGEGVAANAGSGLEETGRAISFQERAGKPGGGKGILIQNERTGALSTLNNQSVCCLNDQGGSQMAVSEDVSGTLRAQEHGHQPIVYGISSDGSNAMKSSNPHSGIYEAETTRTLDNNGGNPACNQGGMIVLEGNGSRPSHQGDGYKESEISYTLNAVEHHAVCIENHPADSRVKIAEDGMVQTLSSRMGTGGGNVPMVMEAQRGYAMQAIGEYKDCESASSLKQRDYKDATDLVVAYGLDRASFNQGQNAKFSFSIEEEKNGAQVAKGPGAVCTGGKKDAGTQNQILRLLWSTYGAETVIKWGVDVMVALQQTEVLRQRVHESSVQSEAENWQKLDGGTPPCPSVVAGWLLRDMRQQQECGCTSQGWQSSEQRFEQFNESMPELSQQNSQTCKDLFDMWSKGEGIGLLQQTLHQIQEIRRSIDVPRQSIVRRLTPLEAERLQGFPDHWTDIGEWIDSKDKKHKDADSPRYKALGNSIALPFWEWMAKRMCGYLDNPTMASLFDGIGGFPLSFSRAGCQPVWASEIEEFPIAVTKKHFPDME